MFYDSMTDSQSSGKADCSWREEVLQKDQPAKSRSRQGALGSGEGLQVESTLLVKGLAVGLRLQWSLPACEEAGVKVSCFLLNFLCIETLRRAGGTVCYCVNFPAQRRNRGRAYLQQHTWPQMVCRGGMCPCQGDSSEERRLLFIHRTATTWAAVVQPSPKSP